MHSAKDLGDWFINPPFTLLGDIKMDAERKDKGTVRELTEIADMIHKTGVEVLRDIRNAKADILDGLSVSETQSELAESTEKRFTALEKEVRQYDQRDRLVKDKE